MNARMSACVNVHVHAQAYHMILQAHWRSATHKKTWRRLRRWENNCDEGLLSTDTDAGSHDSILLDKLQAAERKVKKKSRKRKVVQTSEGIKKA